MRTTVQVFLRTAEKKYMQAQKNQADAKKEPAKPSTIVMEQSISSNSTPIQDNTDVQSSLKDATTPAEVPSSAAQPQGSAEELSVEANGQVVSADASHPDGATEDITEVTSLG